MYRIDTPVGEVDQTVRGIVIIGDAATISEQSCVELTVSVVGISAGQCTGSGAGETAVNLCKCSRAATRVTHA